MTAARKVVVVAVVGVALGLVVVLVRARRYERFVHACESIEPGSSLAEARARLEEAGGRWVARVEKPDGVEHQWVRVRFSFKHQSCGVTVDATDRVLAVEHRDVWDLL